MAAKVTVRELVTKLTIGGNASDKLAKFGLAMNGVKAGLSIMVGAVKAASAATLGLVDDVTKVGDSIAKTSRQIGITAKSFQRLSFAAERSGASSRSLRKGLLNVSKNLRDAQIAAGKGKGTGFTGALAEIGLKFKDLKDLSPEKQLGLLGDALNGITDKGRRAALAQKLLGERSGPELASLLAEGTKGLGALGDKAEELGLVMGDKALGASEAFQDSMTNLQSVLKGIKQTVGVALIPIIQKSIDKFSEWLVVNKSFIAEKFEDGVKVLTNAFEFLLNNIDEIVGGFKSLAELSGEVLSFFRDLSDAVGGIERLVKLATAAWVTYKVAAIAATTGLALGPIGLLAVGLLAVGAAFAEIETNADRARKARDRFNAGLKESDPVNKKQAASDAAAIAKAAREGNELPPALRARLARQGSRQTQISFDAAKASIRSGIKNRADRLAKASRVVVGGKFGTVRRGGARSEKLLQNAGAGQLGLLKELELQVVGLRKDAAISREAGAEQSDLDFVTSTLLPGGGLGGGGRRTRPISEGLGGGKKKADESLSDLLAGAIKSGALPESAALLASSQPPIIIPITNITVQMDVDASTEVNGIAGEDVESFGERVRDVVTEELGTQFRSAIDELRPQLAR